MNRKDNKLKNQLEGSEGPLENPPLEWMKEDLEIEDRKPNLAEIEEDTSEL